jgi:hypothetical protein
MLLTLLRAVVVAIALAACTSAPPAPSLGPPAASAAPSAALDPAIAEWIKFRTAVGLRADETWVREVAANPASRAGSDAYEIPLLPMEVAFLQDRNQRIEDAHAFGASYGAAFPDGFAGEAIDTEHGDRLVLLYTKDVELHQLRMAVMPPASRPEVRRAKWTLDELTDFQWLVTGGAGADPRIRFYSADIDVLQNHLRVNFSSNRRSVGDDLIKRFNSTGWLLPVWLGRLDPWNGPFGSLRIRVVDRDGAPKVDLPCRYTALDPDMDAANGGDTNSKGECFFQGVPIGPYRVDILDRDEQVERLLKSVETEVVADETNIVRVVLP